MSQEPGCGGERLRQALEQRREEIAYGWYQAMAHTSFSPLSASEIKKILASLTERAILFICSPGADDDSEARSIGRELVRLNYVSSEALNGTLSVLSEELRGEEELTPQLQTRLVELLRGVSTGFCEEAKNWILREQESVREALLAEKERVKQDLQHSEKSLAEAQRIAELGHWEHDWHRNRLIWSDELYRIFGVEKETFSATREAFQQQVHPVDRLLVEDAMYEAFSGGTRHLSFEHRIVRPTNEVRHLRQLVEVIYDEGGSPARLLGTVQDITKRKTLELELEHRAYHDALTGLPNRALLIERLKQGCSLSDRVTDSFSQPTVARSEDYTAAGDAGRSIAVLFIDLDDFKTVNDSLGHEAGDALLVAVSQRLRSCLRARDLIARLGGDEFAVLVSGEEAPGEVYALAERIAEKIKAPYSLCGREVFVSASIGVAFGGLGEYTALELLRNADLAMYQAKWDGRAYDVFNLGLVLRTQERLELENDLQRATEREELVLHYQPKIDLASGSISGVEALVRWRHPERGLLGPDKFIPLAEESGAIHEVGRWVIRQACRDLCRWREIGLLAEDAVVCVNISPVQIQDPSLAPKIVEILEELELERGSVALELTESVISRDVEAVCDFARSVHELAIPLFIDDFGEGYSSFTLLGDLPASGLKVSKTLTDGLMQRPVSRAIVGHVIELAHALGMISVAEGVEELGQAEALEQLGCDLAQGFYFFKPVLANEMERLLVPVDE